MGNKKKYWICVIGAANETSLKSGSDSPIRNATEKAYKEVTGNDNDSCYSGWGNDENKADVVKAVCSMDKNDPMYIQLVKELKAVGRINICLNCINCTLDDRKKKETYFCSITEKVINDIEQDYCYDNYTSV